MSEKGICPRCKKYKSLRYRHPKTKVPICSACYLIATGKVGFCTRCKEGPKLIPYRDPETKEPICHNCHYKIKRTEKGLPLRENRYPTSESVIEALAVREKEGKQNYAGVLLVENPSLYRKARKFGIPLPRRKSFRKNPYPTRESVIEALRARTREGKQNNAKVLIVEDVTLYRKALKFGVALPRTRFVVPRRAKKPAISHKTSVVTPSPVVEHRVIDKSEESSKKPLGEPKYSSRKATIAALEARKGRREENFPDVLMEEDILLCCAARKFGVELPARENSPVVYYGEDLVRNQNPRDTALFGQIGRVLGANKKGVAVDFGEKGRVKRVYEYDFNISNIVLHARNSTTLREVAPKEVAPT